MAIWPRSLLRRQRANPRVGPALRAVLLSRYLYCRVELGFGRAAFGARKIVGPSARNSA
jgi:hypothetical protein